MYRPIRCLAVAILFTTVSAVRAADAPPEAGKPAPDINLPATQVEKVLPDAKGALKLSDLKGKKNVVLYFYPKAMTRGCTIESCGFRDLADKFAALDTVVIGISTDTLDDQKKFTDKESLNFPLVADADKAATKAYGALGPRGFANRYTFVIDKQGMIRRTYLQVNPANHPQEVLTFVKENLAKN
jgi:peroxiredoxin Q/BCP